MNAGFSNVYDDEARSLAYATLEFPGSYFLAFRDLPSIIGEHVLGTKALDFGCGAGRSTRFLRGLGFEVVGVDISEPMLARARERDPAGDYRLLPAGDVAGVEGSAYDLVLSAFTFDNVPTMEKKVTLFRDLKGLLKPRGRIVNLVSSPEIYVHEWASFSTKDFPKNRAARCGDEVLILMLDVEDQRPVEDIVWTDEGYREVYHRAGVRPEGIYRPLGKQGEPCAWVNETRIAPWVIYVLGPAEQTVDIEFCGERKRGRWNDRLAGRGYEKVRTELLDVVARDTPMPIGIEHGRDGLDRGLLVLECRLVPNHHVLAVRSAGKRRGICRAH